MKEKIVKLKNGGVLIYEKNKLNDSTAVEVGFKVGSFNESRAGTAHFLEHTLFKKTKNRTNAKVDQDRNEIAFLNASTSMDYIVVKFFRTNKLLDSAMEFASDVLLNSVIDGEFLDSEKGVIKEELAMCKDNESRDIFLKNIRQAMSKSRFSMDIVGKTAENIDKITFKVLKNYKDKNFIGNNFVASVTSSLSLCKIKRLVNKYFASKLHEVKNYKPAKSYYETNVIDKDTSLKIYKNEQEKVSVMLSFRLEADELDIYLKNYNYGFLTKYLSGSQGELFLNLRNKGLIYRLDSDITSFKGESLFFITFESSREKIKEIVDIISSEIKKLATTMVDEKPIEAFKKNLEYYEDEKMPVKMTSRSHLNLMDYLCYGKLFDLKKRQRKKLIAGVNAAEVNRIVREIFKKDNKMYVTVLGNAKKSHVPSLKEFKEKFLIVE